jgi:hypothetical protein
MPSNFQGGHAGQVLTRAFDIDFDMAERRCLAHVVGRAQARGGADGEISVEDMDFSDFY